MNWGDVPTWVSAWVTAAALYAAFRVYRIESDRDQRAEKERRERFATERRAQADKIASWYSIWTPKVINLGGPSKVGGAVIKNASDLPVYNVEVIFWCEPVNPAKDKPLFESPLFHVVPPQDQIRTGDDFFERIGVSGLVGTESIVTSLVFRDAAGIRWERDVHGKLIELGPESPIF